MLRPFLRRIRQAGYLVPASLTGYLWLKGGMPHLPGWSCPLRVLTGIPCPTCFLTRATALALRGNLQTSWQWHPLGPLVAAALLAWSLTALRQRRLVPPHLALWPLMSAGGSLVGAVWLARLPAWVGAP